MSDLYAVMGVPRGADGAAIEAAYKRLARQYHPDRNIGDPSAEAKFKEVANAYEVLGSPTRRAEYDRQGYVGRRPPAPPPPPRKDPPKAPKTADDFRREWDDRDRKDRQKTAATQRELDEVQCSYFGGTATGRHIQVQLKLTPAQMKAGGRHTVRVKRRNLCGTCVGDGTALRMCPRCKGEKPDLGWCPLCEGQGATHVKCPACRGEGVLAWAIYEVPVVVSPGVQAGHTVNVLGEGEAAPRKAPGNLRVVVVQ